MAVVSSATCRLSSSSVRGPIAVRGPRNNPSSGRGGGFIEVSDSTLAEDRDEVLESYAAAVLGDWIVNLRADASWNVARNRPCHRESSPRYRTYRRPRPGRGGPVHLRHLRCCPPGSSAIRRPVPGFGLSLSPRSDKSSPVDTDARRVVTGEGPQGREPLRWIAPTKGREPVGTPLALGPGPDRPGMLADADLPRQNSPMPGLPMLGRLNRGAENRPGRWPIAARPPDRPMWPGAGPRTRPRPGREAGTAPRARRPDRSSRPPPGSRDPRPPWPRSPKPADPAIAKVRSLVQSGREIAREDRDVSGRDEPAGAGRRRPSCRPRTSC